jgi:hypothetical protein
VKLQMLNDYALAAVGLFAIAAYIAMVAWGYAELRSRFPKVGAHKKRSRNKVATRR